MSAIIDRKLTVMDRRDLRAKVSSYVRVIQFHCSNILLYRTFIENNNNFTWEQYLNEQSIGMLFSRTGSRFSSHLLSPAN